MLINLKEKENGNKITLIRIITSKSNKTKIIPIRKNWTEKEIRLIL